MCVVMLVARLLLLMVFGFESGCLGKHFAKDVLHKSTFAEVGILMSPGSIFHDFGWPLGPVDLGIPGSSTCYLACLVASLWRPRVAGAILGHSGAQERKL